MSPKVGTGVDKHPTHRYGANSHEERSLARGIRQPGTDNPRCPPPQGGMWSHTRQRSVRVRPDGASDRCSIQLLPNGNEQRMERKLITRRTAIESSISRITSPTDYRSNPRKAQPQRARGWTYMPAQRLMWNRTVHRYRFLTSDLANPEQRPSRIRTFAGSESPTSQFNYLPTRREQ